LLWPVICFVVLESTMVHRLSVVPLLLEDISEEGRRPSTVDRSRNDPMDTMEHENGNGEPVPKVSGSEDESSVA
jgi:hypothetical protein